MIEFSSCSLQGFFEVHCRDLSAVGIFIRTTERLKVATPIRFKFVLQDRVVFLMGTGRVAWGRNVPRAGAAAGLGLSFSELSPASANLMERMLEFKEAKIQLVDSPSLDAELAMIGDEAAAVPFKDTLTIKATISAPAPRILDSADRSSAAGTIEMAPPASIHEASASSPCSRTGEQSADKRGKEIRRVKSGQVPWLRWAVVLLILGAGAGIFLLNSSPHPAAHPQRSSQPQGERVAPIENAMGTKKNVTEKKVQIRIDSVPTGARIIINGKDTGKRTPAELANLNPEVELALLIDLPGKKLNRTRLRPASNLEYVARLKPARRRVQLSTNPKGAMVFLNSFKLGTTPLEIKKTIHPKGTYWIRVEADGYQPLVLKILGSDLTWQRQGDDEVSKILLSLEK